MDSERPKTPSWAFTAPDLVKNSKSYACCHFSFLQALLPVRHSAPPGKVNLAPERFRLQNLAPMHVPENGANCRLVNGTNAPQVGGAGRMGGPYGHVPAHKGSTVLKG